MVLAEPRIARFVADLAADVLRLLEITAFEDGGGLFEFRAVEAGGVDGLFI